MKQAWPGCSRQRWWASALVAGAALVIAAPAVGKPPRSGALANVAPGERAAADDIDADRELVQRVTFQRDGRHRTVEGRVLVAAADGGVLLQSDDGALWALTGGQVVDRQPTTTPFQPITSDALAEKLLAELPAGFRVHTTPRYVICYNTSRQYAEWTSSLFERLYKAFTSYWKRAGLALHEPEFPLPVIVFADRASYEQAARKDLGGPAGGIVAYYSLESNRVNMYDLTGVESLRGPGNRRGSLREINLMLSQPAAVPLVSTIVHEATHSIAFNCGLQARYADIPLWLCEGMAMYFEAPDLGSSRGWRGIGRVNYARLETFQRNLPDWRDDSLETLLADSRRFRDQRTALAAYADAWALNYYLIKYRSADYAAYLKLLADKQPLIEDDPATRLDEFRQHFGELPTLEREFLRQMSRM